MGREDGCRVRETLGVLYSGGTGRVDGDRIVIVGVGVVGGDMLIAGIDEGGKCCCCGGSDEM